MLAHYQNIHVTHTMICSINARFGVHVHITLILEVHLISQHITDKIQVSVKSESSACKKISLKRGVYNKNGICPTTDIYGITRVSCHR